MATTEGLEQLTITVEDAAKVLGIPRRSVYEHVRTGRLPHIELGRRKLILKSGLEGLIKDARDRADAARV